MNKKRRDMEVDMLANPRHQYFKNVDLQFMSHGNANSFKIFHSGVHTFYIFFSVHVLWKELFRNKAGKLISALPNHHY